MRTLRGRNGVVWPRAAGIVGVAERKAIGGDVAKIVASEGYAQSAPMQLTWSQMAGVSAKGQLASFDSIAVAHAPGVAEYALQRYFCVRRGTLG